MSRIPVGRHVDDHQRRIVLDQLLRFRGGYVRVGQHRRVEGRRSRDVVIPDGQVQHLHGRGRVHADHLGKGLDLERHGAVVRNGFHADDRHVIHGQIAGWIDEVLSGKRRGGIETRIRACAVRIRHIQGCESARGNGHGRGPGSIHDPALVRPACRQGGKLKRGGWRRARRIQEPDPVSVVTVVHRRARGGKDEGTTRAREVGIERSGALDVQVRIPLVKGTRHHVGVGGCGIVARGRLDGQDEHGGCVGLIRVQIETVRGKGTHAVHAEAARGHRGAVNHDPTLVHEVRAQVRKPLEVQVQCLGHRRLDVVAGGDPGAVVAFQPVHVLEARVDELLRALHRRTVSVAVHEVHAHLVQHRYCSVQATVAHRIIHSTGDVSLRPQWGHVDDHQRRIVLDQLLRLGRRHVHVFGGDRLFLDIIAGGDPGVEVPFQPIHVLESGVHQVLGSLHRRSVRVAIHEVHVHLVQHRYCSVQATVAHRIIHSTGDVSLRPQWGHVDDHQRRVVLDQFLRLRGRHVHIFGRQHFLLDVVTSIDPGTIIAFQAVHVLEAGVHKLLRARYRRTVSVAIHEVHAHLVQHRDRCVQAPVTNGIAQGAGNVAIRPVR